MDRLIASRMGYHAVECLIEGKHNVFVGIVNNKITYYTPLNKTVKKTQRISEEDESCKYCLPDLILQ